MHFTKDNFMMTCDGRFIPFNPLEDYEYVVVNGQKVSELNKRNKWTYSINREFRILTSELQEGEWEPIGQIRRDRALRAEEKQRERMRSGRGKLQPKCTCNSCVTCYRRKYDQLQRKRVNRIVERILNGADFEKICIKNGVGKKMKEQIRKKVWSNLN